MSLSENKSYEKSVVIAQICLLSKIENFEVNFVGSRGLPTNLNNVYVVPINIWLSDIFDLKRIRSKPALAI